jgi:hypothetical protein
MEFRGDFPIAQTACAAFPDEFRVWNEFRLKRFARHRCVQSRSNLFKPVQTNRADARRGTVNFEPTLNARLRRHRGFQTPKQC